MRTRYTIGNFASETGKWAAHVQRIPHRKILWKLYVLVDRRQITRRRETQIRSEAKFQCLKFGDGTDRQKLPNESDNQSFLADNRPGLISYSIGFLAFEVPRCSVRLSRPELLSGKKSDALLKDEQERADRAVSLLLQDRNVDSVQENRNHNTDRRQQTQPTQCPDDFTSNESTQPEADDRSGQSHVKHVIQIWNSHYNLIPKSEQATSTHWREIRFTKNPMNVSPTPEFRTDILTGLQVLVAPVRSSRPSAVHPEPTLTASEDPFAEGNEHETPDERFAVRDAGSSVNGPGWQLRIVPNRYPAVALPEEDWNSDSTATSSPFFPAQPAWGEHDVVVECPDSRSRMADLSMTEVQRIFSAWRTRMQQWAQSGELPYVSVFRNEGFSAGASLAHCHSQMIAYQQPSPLDLERQARAISHRQKSATEITLDLLNAERAAGTRMICETTHFAVCCPFASRTAWHVRFIPASPEPVPFSATADAQIEELATLVKSTLTHLEHIMGGPFSFNLTLPHPRLNQPMEFRWMLDLLPRTGRTAGWEFLTAVDILTVTPEHAAAQLRAQNNV